MTDPSQLANSSNFVLLVVRQLGGDGEGLFENFRHPVDPKEKPLPAPPVCHAFVAQIKQHFEADLRHPQRPVGGDELSRLFALAVA